MTDLHTETLPGGAMTSFVLRRGMTLRLTDPEGGGNVSALFYNADMPLERYNMPDTLKAQFTAFLTAGRILYSDMGRILCSIPEDTAGWHDTLCGVLGAEKTREKYGPSSYQEARNDFHRNGRDNFLIELSKQGMGKRDLHANVNFFSKVTVDDAGGLHFVPKASAPGSHVDLRAEMNVLVVLSNTPHPLAPAGRWNPPAVTLSVRASALPGPADACRVSRPENIRGFLNTEALFAREPA
jgi:urea carboxylase-associated protein 2